MTDLEKYEAVNSSKTLNKLANVIRSFGVEGEIQGRERKFDCEKMADHCESYSLQGHNFLTREFGIRQQAMMLSFYDRY
jgi:hypothetical protein